MYTEADLLPLSALQHILFCERQCALIHLEGIWDDNRLTVEGTILHEKAHEAGLESRIGVRISRGVMLRTLRLGLTGKADVVEFHQAKTGSENPGLHRGTMDASVSLNGTGGTWVPFPVEYKRGRPKTNRCDEVQLCAQALCIEEMMNVQVPRGALYYHTPRRRKDVELDSDLRSLTEETAARLHALFARRETPAALYESKCENCSLRELCLPETLGRRPQVEGYIDRALRTHREGGDG